MAVEHSDRSLPPDALTFLRELSTVGVRFLCRGFTTYKINDRPIFAVELQFEDVNDPRIGAAAATVASRWFPDSSVGAFLGAALGETVEVFEDPPGVSLFALEYEYMTEERMVGDVPVRWLSAGRVCRRNAEISSMEGVEAEPLEMELAFGPSCAVPPPAAVEESPSELVFTTEGAPDGYVFVTIPSCGEGDEHDDYELESWTAAPPRVAARVRPSRQSRRSDYSAGLVLNAPLQFRRVVASGTSPCGLEVLVEVGSDLTVIVTHRGERVLEGAYGGDRVHWASGATATMPVCSREMVGEDIRYMLLLFQRELLDVRRWTTDARAIERLAPALDEQLGAENRATGVSLSG